MLDYRGNFEVHLTVHAASALDAFRDWCENRRCKCVRIELARGEQTQQPMATWHRNGTTLPDIFAEATQRTAELQQEKFSVVRVKIEADPSNDGVPTSDNEAQLQPPANYFEHHVKLRRSTSAETDKLLRLCLDHSAHLSRNAWRQPAEGFEERFVTLRSYRVGRSSSDAQLQSLIAALQHAGEEIIDVESEYTVYDSNVALDAGWLPQSPL